MAADYTKILDKLVRLNRGMWIAVKFQSSLEIAGSPRNSFRASLKIREAEVEH